MLLILLMTVMQWQQYPNDRPNGQRRRQQWSFLIQLFYLCATLHRIEIVVAFNYRQRFVSPTRESSVRGWGTSYRRQSFITLLSTQQQQRRFIRHQMQHSDATSNSTSSLPLPVSTTPNTTTDRNKKKYDLGVGKHPPFSSDTNSTTSIISSVPSSDTDDQEERNRQNGDGTGEESSSTTGTALNARLIGMNWMAPESVVKPMIQNNTTVNGLSPPPPPPDISSSRLLPETKSRRMVARDNEGQILRGALWDERHFDLRGNNRNVPIDVEGNVNGDVSSTLQQTLKEVNINFNGMSDAPTVRPANTYNSFEPPYPKAFYPDIDLSIPDSVYSDDVDLVWDLLRYEAYQNQQQQYEPLLVSFLHSTILNHDTLESSLAFLLANRLQSPAMMISTQLQALILSALQDCAQFRRKLRADIMAVRDRDPACHTLPDVFLYFKGFHALQSYRTAHVLWNSGRTILAQYLQSQVSQIFQIDIHPNATIGSGIMLDHGTGIVIGETATVGHNCSILHHVTLGGSGKKGIIRHPAVGNGVLLGAGATVLGPITIGDGCQVGAGTLVISDLPSHCVAVGVPARIIGSFVDVTTQPSIGMDQIIDSRDKIITFESDGI